MTIKPIIKKIIKFLFLIILPLLSIRLGADSSDVSWQDGFASSYVKLYFHPEVSKIYILPLLYCAFCLSLLNFRFEKFQKYSWVRAGAYAGFIQVFYLAILVGLTVAEQKKFASVLNFLMILICSLAPLFFRYLIIQLKILQKRFGSKKFSFILVLSYIVLGFVVLILLALSNSNTILQFFNFLSDNFVMILVIPPILVLLFHPIITLFLTYEIVLKLWPLDKNSQSLRPLYAPLTIWSTSFLGLNAMAIMKTIEIYNKLPKDRPPDCYVATAAAHGIPIIVGSEINKTRNFRYNKQMQYLKAFEIILEARIPAFHKNLRQIYNKYGYYLSKKIQSQGIATLAYLLLYPLGMLARGFFSFFGLQVKREIKKIYST